jgi:hypothetical protein
MCSVSKEATTMTGLETLQNVQYVTGHEKRFAVIDTDDWNALLESLEIIEDVEAAQKVHAGLTEAGGDRQTAGWLNWNEINSKTEPLCP